MWVILPTMVVQFTGKTELVISLANYYLPPRGGHTLIWAIRGRAAVQGMVFWPRCPKQGIQFDLLLN